MKKTFLAAAAAVTLSFALPGFAQVGPGPGPGPGTGPRVPAVQSATPEEAKWLAFMREEEKLARDVYRFLYDRWKLTVFDRIAESESTHFVQMGTLIKRYSLTDPSAADTPGVFTDERFAVLYAELTAKGGASIKDALEVGLVIEKQDIADLETALKEVVKLDIKRVFVNLMNASFNHQEAFEFNLELLAAM